MLARSRSSSPAKIGPPATSKLLPMNRMRSMSARYSSVWAMRCAHRYGKPRVLDKFAESRDSSAVKRLSSTATVCDGLQRENRYFARFSSVGDRTQPCSDRFLIPVDGSISSPDTPAFFGMPKIRLGTVEDAESDRSSLTFMRYPEKRNSGGTFEVIGMRKSLLSFSDGR
jgi:hypothetical protein